MATHNDLGEEGEKLATAHLQEKGHTILHTNWRFGKDEIDIISKDGDTLVFVEVKTRYSTFFGDPEGFISMAKQNRMIKAANAYLKENEIDSDSRFDVIGIILNSQTKELKHIEDAFFATV